MNRILVIDDQEVVRVGLKTLVTEALSTGAWGEASTVQEALRLLSEQPQWDLVILELLFDHNRGLQLLKDLRRQQPNVPILILTSHPEEQYAIRAIKAGASGYISKTCEAAELTKAIKKVLHGGRYVSTALAETLGTSNREGTEAIHETLSDREYQVMRLIGSGKTVGEIATFLSISDKTVSTYRARILDKTSLKNNAEIVRYVVENGLLD